MDFKQKNTRFLFPVFIIIFLIIFLLDVWGDSFTHLKSYNLLSKLTHHEQASDNVVLIVIDDKSLLEIGRWPWKRENYINIFDFIENYTSAKIMGYDAIIVAPDLENPQSDKKFFSKVKDFKKLVAGFAFSYNDFDRSVDIDKYENLLKEKANINIVDKRAQKYKIPSQYQSFSALLKDYFRNINSVGFVSITEDYDGYIRRATQLIDYKGKLYPSLAFAMYAKYYGIKEFELTDNSLSVAGDKKFLNIPVDIKKFKGYIQNYIYYYDTVDDDNVYSHKKYSASDIINSYRAIKKGQKPVINPAEFDNKIVFIGACAQAQALADIKRTPISEGFSGVDIQATNFDNLMTNRFFKVSSLKFDLFICIFMVLLVFWLVNTCPIAIALISSIFAGFLYYLFAHFMFLKQVAINLILPEFFILVALGFAYSYRYLIEDTKKTKIQKAMGKYLSYDVMQNVVKNIDNIELGGKRADITVLFADIRNFTSISENMDAASTSMILNEYFSELVPIIEKNNGVLNKFMGDAILAIFGEPKKSDNHALDAVQCGYQMLKKVKYLQEKWLDEGKPKIEIGIGVSSGDAFVGNIGSSERLEYTVIGDTVNTASRIENYNKVYRTNFLISEETYKRTKDKIDVITIKDVLIRGKANKVNLYEVIRLID